MTSISMNQQQPRKKKGGKKGTQNLSEIRFRKQFVKTQMCANFVIGLCERGKQCLFAHSPKEIRSRPCLNKTKMCPNGESCDKKDTCLFAHEREELVSTNEFTKTKLCHFGQRCLQKENCRYAHTLGELRKVKRKNVSKSESNSNDNNNNFYDVFEMVDGTSSSTISQNKMFSGRKSNTAKKSYSENESQDTLPSDAFEAIKMAYAQMRQQELLSHQASINFNNCDNQTRAAIAASMGLRSIHMTNNDTNNNDNIKYMNMINYQQQQQQQTLSSTPLVPFQLQQSPYNNHSEEIINNNSLINKNSFNNNDEMSTNNTISDNLINKNSYNLSFTSSNIQNNHTSTSNNISSIQSSQILQSYNKLDENQSTQNNQNFLHHPLRISKNIDDTTALKNSLSTLSIQGSKNQSLSFQSFKDDENYNKFLHPSDILRQSRRNCNNAFNSRGSESSCAPAFSQDAQRILTETLLNAQPERYED